MQATYQRKEVLYLPWKMSKGSELKSLLEALLKRQDLNNNKVERIISVTEMDAVPPGKNYMSLVKRIVVEATLSSRKVTTRYLIRKELPSGPLTQAFVSRLRLFERELKCYSDVLPVFEDFLEKQGCLDEVLWPRCIDVRSTDLIILEDLQTLGFKMVNKVEGMDLEHSTLAVEALGLFHSLSLLTKEHAVLSSEIFSEAYTFHTDSQVKEFSKALTNLIPAMKSWGDEWNLAADHIQELIPRVKERFTEMFHLNQTRLNVLNHGDCWANNLMFKYNPYTNTPEKVRLVDFQQSYYNTPALDVVYFLATSPNLDVRSRHVNDLIHVYHQSLTKNMDRFQVDCRRPSYSEIRDEINRLGLFHFCLVLTLVPKLAPRKDDREIFDLEEWLKMRDSSQSEEEATTSWLDFTNEYFTSILKVSLKQGMENRIFK